MHRAQRRQQVEALGADVLELEGDDVHRRGEAAQRVGVLVVAQGDAGADQTGGTVRLRGQDVAAVAETGGGEGGHATQLAAADDADGGVERQHHVANLT